MKVIDASVAAKWFFEEEGTLKALALRDRYINREYAFSAPDLLLLEMANLFCKRHRRLSKDRAREGFQALLDLKIELYPITPDLALRSLEIAQKYDLTPYDGAYVALAEILKAPLISADKPLLRSAGALVKTETLD